MSPTKKSMNISPGSPLALNRFDQPQRNPVKTTAAMARPTYRSLRLAFSSGVRGRGDLPARSIPLRRTGPALKQGSARKGQLALPPLDLGGPLSLDLGGSTHSIEGAIREQFRPIARRSEALIAQVAVIERRRAPLLPFPTISLAIVVRTYPEALVNTEVWVYRPV